MALNIGIGNWNKVGEKFRSHWPASDKITFCDLSATTTDMRLAAIGINENDILGSDDMIVHATPDAHCISLILRVLCDNFGVSRGFFSGSQHDGSLSVAELPNTSSDAVRSVGQLLPDLRGTIEGFTLHEPTAGASCLTVVAEVHFSVSAPDVRNAFRQYADGPLHQILSVSAEPVVPADVSGCAHSAIIDLPSVKVLGEKLVQVTAWYDAPIAFQNRIIDLFNYLQSYE